MGRQTSRVRARGALGNESDLRILRPRRGACNRKVSARDPRLRSAPGRTSHGRRRADAAPSADARPVARRGDAASPRERAGARALVPDPGRDRRDDVGSQRVISHGARSLHGPASGDGTCRRARPTPRTSNDGGLERGRVRSRGATAGRRRVARTRASRGDAAPRNDTRPGGCRHPAAGTRTIVRAGYLQPQGGGGGAHAGGGVNISHDSSSGSSIRGMVASGRSGGV